MVRLKKGLRYAVLATTLLGAGVVLGRWSAPQAAKQQPGTLDGWLGRWVTTSSEQNGSENDRAATATAEPAEDSTPTFAQILATKDRGERATLLNRLADSKEHSVADLLDFSDELRSETVRDYFVAAVLARWAEDDPESAVHYAFALRNPHSREIAMNHVVNKWVDKNPRAVLRWATSQDTNRQTRNATANALQAIAQDDPSLALGLAKELPPTASSGAIGHIFRRLVEQDPDKALDALADIGHRSHRRLAIDAISDQWAQVDPEAAVAWAQTLEKQERSAALGAGLNRLAARDPQAAAAVAMQAYAAGGSVDGIRSVAAQWVETDPQSALAWLKTLPKGQFRTVATEQAVYALTNEHPMRAAEHVMATTSGSQRDQLVGHIAMVWAGQDLEAATEWVQGIQEPRARDAALANIASNWMREDMPQALKKIGELAPGSTRDQFLYAATRQLAGRDPAAAAEWLNTLDRTEATEMADVLVQEWAGTAPDAAGDWLLSLPAGSNRQSAIDSLAMVWARDQPESAAAWVLSNTDGEAQLSATNYLVHSWADIDSLAATKWVDSLPPGDTLDRALMALGDSSNIDARSSWELIERIGDPELRQTQLSQLAYAWRERNADSASAWADQVETDKTVAALLRGEEPPNGADDTPDAAEEAQEQTACVCPPAETAQGS